MTTEEARAALLDTFAAYEPPDMWAFDKALDALIAAVRAEVETENCFPIIEANTTFAARVLDAEAKLAALREAAETVVGQGRARAILRAALAATAAEEEL